MRIKPILMSTEMVRAILDGRKSTKRLVVKPQIPDVCPSCHYMHSNYEYDGAVLYCARCGETVDIHPPYNPGDILYVRETWAQPFLPRADEIHYRADYSDSDIVLRDGPYPDAQSVHDVKWCPFIHMPREAARIWLRVTDVRVERLQEITVDGINSEGLDVEPPPICKKGEPTESERAAFARLTAQKQDEYISTLARHTYMGWCKYADDLFAAWKNLWDSTVKLTDRERYGWAANPFCWVISFERISKDEAMQ